jgi:prepilin-type N-terminal cleavage/methylation domain-containing protein
MNKNLQKGFTLIELLVVIAIIGILSSVVLASLNTARGKGADAAIKSNLANMRAQAEIYYDDASLGNGTYGPATTASNACTAGVFGNTTITNGVTSATSASGGSGATGAPTARRCAIGVGGSSWAISIPLKTDTAKSFCVDNSGTAKEVNGNIPALGGGAAAAACPAS